MEPGFTRKLRIEDNGLDSETIQKQLQLDATMDGINKDDHFRRNQTKTKEGIHHEELVVVRTLDKGLSEERRGRRGGRVLEVEGNRVVKEDITNPFGTIIKSGRHEEALVDFGKEGCDSLDVLLVSK